MKDRQYSVLALLDVCIEGSESHSSSHWESAHQRQDTSTCLVLYATVASSRIGRHYFVAILLSVKIDIETNCSLAADSNVNKSTVVQGSFILSQYPLLSCCMVPKYQCGDDASLVFVEHLNSPVKPLSLPCLDWAPELSSPLISPEWCQWSNIGDKEELRGSVNNAGI